jgi:hypothetical protein
MRKSIAEEYRKRGQALSARIAENFAKNLKIVVSCLVSCLASGNSLYDFSQNFFNACSRSAPKTLTTPRPQKSPPQLTSKKILYSKL